MAMIVADIGSCHGNRLAYFERAIAVAKDLRVQLKCQLFGKDIATGGNVLLQTGIYVTATELAQHAGVPLFASIWSYADYDLARSVAKATGASIVKFAYSQRNNALIEQATRDFATVYVSCQHLDLRNDDPPNLRRLLCIPEYPVYGQPALDCCFPAPFYGFSDHTLGVVCSMYAFAKGAELVEKHVKFEGYADCPDAKFAIDEHELGKLVEYVE